MQSAHRCRQRAMTGINQIIYWIITPHWLRVARARFCIINLTARRRERAMTIGHAKEKGGIAKEQNAERTCISFFFFPPPLGPCVSECPSTSPHELFIISPSFPPSLHPPTITPPSGSNPRLCVAAEPVRLQGPSFTASAGRCHTCLIFFLFFICNNSALIVRPRYSSRSLTGPLLLQELFQLQKTRTSRRN